MRATMPMGPATASAHRDVSLISLNECAIRQDQVDHRTHTEAELGRRWQTLVSEHARTHHPIHGSHREYAAYVGT
jgi:hypothetical protein